MTPEMLIVHKGQERHKLKVEFWNGRCWTSLRRYAKTYPLLDARQLMRQRFQGDPTAKIIPCTVERISL